MLNTLDNCTCTTLMGNFKDNRRPLIGVLAIFFVCKNNYMIAKRELYRYYWHLTKLQKSHVAKILITDRNPNIKSTETIESASGNVVGI